MRKGFTPHFLRGKNNNAGSLKKGAGFTLIEILIVLGILAILAAIVIIAINPGQHFEDARKAKRQADVNTIMNAINQNMIGESGNFDFTDCSETDWPTQGEGFEISGAGGVEDFDLCGCIVPDYVGTMPVEVDKTAIVGCPAGYTTGYYLRRESSGRLTVSSTGELADDNSDDVYVTR